MSHPDHRRSAQPRYGGRVLARRIRLLVAATITYNVIEAVVAITAGTVGLVDGAGRVRAGLGDRGGVRGRGGLAVRRRAIREAREKTALRVIAVSFFALAAYVTVDAVRALFGGGEAEHSTVGLVLAGGVSLLIMPVLSYAQRRAGRELGSASAVADSKQTLLCTYLSAVLLVGLALNTLFGWSWADPIAALVIAAVGRQGRPRGVARRRLLRARGGLVPAADGSFPDTAGCDCCSGDSCFNDGDMSTSAVDTGSTGPIGLEMPASLRRTDAP